MATPDTWLDLGPSRAATSGLVRGTATRGPTAEQRTAARPRSSQVSQRPVDVAGSNRAGSIEAPRGLPFLRRDTCCSGSNRAGSIEALRPRRVRWIRESAVPALTEPAP